MRFIHPPQENGYVLLLVANRATSLPSTTLVAERLCFHKRLSFCSREGVRQTPTPRAARQTPPPPQEMATAADGTHPTGMHSYWFNYHPQTKFAKVMFLHLSVSHSVHGGGACVVGGHAWQEGVWGVACMAGGVRGGGCARHACPHPNTTRYGRSMRGRYASYWNAFLLKSLFFTQNFRNVNHTVCKR